MCEICLYLRETGKGACTRRAGVKSAGYGSSSV